MATLNPAVGTGAYVETLVILRTRILARLGFAAQTTPPPGMVVLVNDFLQSAQEQLARRYPELVTQRYFTWTLVPGTRFYDTDADDEGVTSPDYILDPRRIDSVHIEDLNGTFYPMREGIATTLYTSEANVGLPYAYELRQGIEIFPAPDLAYLLHIKGHYGLLAFASDSDVVSIDPELIFLLSLANAKSHYQQPDAQIYFNQATSHLGQLTAGAYGSARFVPGVSNLPPLTRPVLLPPP